MRRVAQPVISHSRGVDGDPLASAARQYALQPGEEGQWTSAIQYAGGSEKFAVTIDCRMSYSSSVRGSAEVTVTWDEIFYEIGPMMFEEASERQMQSRLSDELWDYEGLKNRPNALPGIREMRNESFETIKVQLFALGLIKRSERKHAPSDINKYWSLTPFGETTLMKLRAIPKKREDQHGKGERVEW